jgi:hypothetical protein
LNAIWDNEQQPGLSPVVEGIMTTRSTEIGRVAGLQLSFVPSALISAVLMWVAFAAIGLFVLNLPALEAVIGGLVAVILHWLSELIHQLGHAWAARRTGYPMTGIRFWGALSASIYPDSEPSLPAAMHIRRALGGPLTSLLVSVLAGIVLLALYPQGGLLRWLALFFFIDNFFVFTLGSLMPLGFTDGSTLLYWRNKT